MYLKRLELQGFKSFHAKTLFEFVPGITSVVGPNGSGKSNVAESIRWVLGEQGARNVRARRMEDLIFSGSSQKAAVGMAEVSITLDNADGWLPLDYSEVVVSRRAYRNGDSEYLINKNKVRLRDVVDLFLRAEVGQNSYAFMGQGLVEDVLVMRPEERRRLLEEAADVRLLRTRLDEARDRLSATRENLERVQLLLDEIEPRLKQLERQASRAAEHGRLARELLETLRELFIQQWIEVQEQLASARAMFDQRQQALAVYNNETKACQDGLTALAEAVEERERELGARRANQRTLLDTAHRLDQRLSLDRERIENQTARKVEIEAELESLRAERADLQTSITQAQERVRAIQPELEDAKGVIATRRQEMSTLEQEQSGLRRRIGDAEDRLERSQRGIKEAESTISRLGHEEARLQGDAERRITRRKELATELLAYRKQAKADREKLAQLEKQIEDAEHERMGLAAMVESGRTSLQQLEAESLETNAWLGQLTVRQELLRRLQSGQEGVEAGARYLLGEEDSGRTEAVEGLVGLVRDIVRVPPGLELAIEAALAENISALVFEHTNLALAAIDMLEEKEAGRALVYPLDAVKASPPVNLMREKGIIGVAARLVRCDNRFRPLVDAILGRTVVVDDIPLAREVLRRGFGSVVTMQGALLRPNGGISGGVTKAAVESFTRQRELDEMPEEIAQARARKEEIDDDLRRERDAYQGSSAALGKIEPKVQSLREDRANRQNSIIEGRGRLLLLRSEAHNLRSMPGGDETDWRGRRVSLQTDLKRHQEEAKLAAAGLEEARKDLSLLSARRNAATDAVTEAAAAHADLEGEARSLTRQVELVQSSLLRTESRLHDREASLKAIDAEMKEIRGRDEASEKELSTVRAQLEALVSELDPSEEELTHLMTRERTMGEQLAAARVALLEAERGHLEAEAAVKLRSDEMEALRLNMESEGFRPDGHTIVEISAPPVEQPSGFPPIRGGADVDVETLKIRVGTLRASIRGLGPVNEQAQQDYGESKERFDFLKGQVDDLTGSEETLMTAIDELESNIRERLKATFAEVDREFQRYFQLFFAGGNARLSLTQPDDFANTGIDIVAQPPGKRINTLAQLSGGERTLTSLALLLSLLEAHPSPICVLDEVDAALDETNVGRFVDALKALEKKTQFIIITHNPRTVEAADAIYGVSMGPDNTSRILSMRLDEIKKN